MLFSFFWLRRLAILNLLRKVGKRSLLEQAVGQVLGKMSPQNYHFSTTLQFPQAEMG